MYQITPRAPILPPHEELDFHKKKTAHMWKDTVKYSTD